VTAGDPSLSTLPSVLSALREGGADVIEVGIPFSDPIADGPTIQASSQRALDSGVTPRAVLSTLGSVSLSIPIVLMTYYNPVLRWGLSSFASAASEAGVSGVIATDLTPEESSDWVAACRAVDLETVFLAAPTSTDERLDAVCACASGFVYAVSRTGVTGSQDVALDEVRSLVSRVKGRTRLPVCVGFGIRNADHVRAISRVADGVVIGSWLVEWLDKNWQAGRGREELVQIVRGLKDATRG